MTAFQSKLTRQVKKQESVTLIEQNIHQKKWAKLLHDMLELAEDTEMLL